MPQLSHEGASLLYSRTGLGPPVLMIQGAGVVGEGWRPQVEALAADFALLSFDNRGIGSSTLEGGELTLEAMAADARAILDAEGIEFCHVVGHSMGGLIAQQLALDAPQRVRSLALLCTFHRGPEAASINAGMLWTALRMRIGTRPMRRRAFLELVFPPSYLRTVDRARLAADLAPLFGHDLASQPAVVLRQVRAMARHDISDRLAELAAIPTLVVSATEDRIARPEYGRALAAAIPGASYVEIPGAGHAVTLQDPARINALLREHWALPRKNPLPPSPGHIPRPR